MLSPNVLKSSMQTLLGDTPTPKNKKKERKKSDNYIDNYMYLDIAKMFTSLPLVALVMCN